MTNKNIQKEVKSIVSKIMKDRNNGVVQPTQLPKRVPNASGK